MGRGRGGKRGGGRGGGPRGRVCEEEEEYMRYLEGQDPRAGRMPSDSEDEEGDPDTRFGPIDHQPVISRQQAANGQNSNVGLLPPSDSEEDDEEEEIIPHGAPAANEPRRRPKDEPDDPDPEQMAKDMERLRLIKEKREKDRLARIEKEGWDRFAPITEENKPPTEGKPVD